MSISEFCVEHGLNSGADFDDWIDTYAHDYEGQAYYARHPYQPPVFGLDASKLDNTAMASEPLDESKLDHFAKAGGWYKLGTRKSEAPMASYYRDVMKLDVALSTGTVGSYMDGRSGRRTEVFRCVVDIHQAEAVFQNPHSPPPPTAEPCVQIYGLEAPVKQEGTSSMGSKDQEEYPLNESGLDDMATTHSWMKLSTTGTSQVPMTSYYREDSMRLEFWLSSGTVGSYLDHPSRGKIQLFRRRQVEMQQVEEIFQNPRVHQHTAGGVGYQRRRRARGKKRERAVGKPEEKRTCRKGKKYRKRQRGPCRYGSQCTRADCWFDHSC